MYPRLLEFSSCQWKSPLLSVNPQKGLSHLWVMFEVVGHSRPFPHSKKVRDATVAVRTRRVIDCSCAAGIAINAQVTVGALRLGGVYHDEAVHIRERRQVHLTVVCCLLRVLRLVLMKATAGAQPESLCSIGSPALAVQVRLGFILCFELLSHVPCIVTSQID